jgi:hypothetical protein
LATLRLTVRGRFALVLYTLPVLEVNDPARLSVDVPAMALALPVSVNVRNKVPADVKPGGPQEAVIPFGNPEAMLMVDQPAFVTKTAPPMGVAVTVTVAVESDPIDSVCGDTANATPSAGCTCNVTLLLAETPSPATVTTTVADDGGIVGDAVSVSVSLFVLTLADGVAGFADHLAVTPAGSPVAEKPIIPVKDPPVTAVSPTVPEPPCTTAIDVDAAFSVRVGGGVTARV